MSTPAPMRPPKRMLPKAMPFVPDLAITMPGSAPSSAQLTVRSLKLRRTVTEPGVVVYQVPLSFTSEHLAPDTSLPLFLVVTDRLWFWPLTMDAQPPRVRHAPSAAHSAESRIMVPSEG